MKKKSITAYDSWQDRCKKHDRNVVKNIIFFGSWFVIGLTAIIVIGKILFRCNG